MGCSEEKLSKNLIQTFTAYCNVMICQQATLSGEAERPKVADAVIEAVCSSSILAEPLGCTVSFSRPLRVKRRVFERCHPVFIDQLQPSTNYDKLSDRGCGDRRS